MPKEQIRKRGKRKPKTEEFFPPAPSAPAPAPVPEPEQEQVEEQQHTGGIHPSRLAFLKTGQRPAPPPRPENDGAEGEGDGQVQDEENGVADWTRGPRYESEYPFGVLDPDVKAYFRNVEDQVKDWEGVGSVGEEREGESMLGGGHVLCDGGLTADRQLFLTSVLTELRGHELQVSTDPDTAVVFERLLPSLNDWGRRVVGDAVGENWETLVRHRFGSHVAQTWLTLAAGTLDREVSGGAQLLAILEVVAHTQARGIYPPQHIAQAKKAKAKTADDDAEGVLPTMAELITTLTQCVQPTLPTLLTSAHASPPVRLLLLVLTPNRALPSLDSQEGGAGDLVRSKRSGKWRKGQGVQGKSILGDDDKGKGKESEARAVPADVAALRRTLRESLMERVQPVEWQGMAVSSVGCPAVQLLLECEVEDGAAGAGSLLDILTEGLVAVVEGKKDAKAAGEKAPKPKPQPYLSAQLVSVTGTRLFEALLKVAPKKVFKALWKTYFIGKLGKLAPHPYANYVVAAGVSRLDAAGIEAAVSEIQGVSGGRGLIKTSRTSVLLALAQRAAALPEPSAGAAATAVVGLVQSSLDLGDHASSLVPCLMVLKTYPVYEALVSGAEIPDSASESEGERDEDAEAAAAAKARRAAWENRRTRKPRGNLDPNLQGCLLLQALLDLPTANATVLDSLFAQPPDTLMAYASSPVASRLLDKVLTAPAVAPKYRRKLYLAFMGRYAELAQDRLGSRVADTVWATADGFMREKIARSLIPSATQLGASQYGRFFARKLDLHLLDRRPDEWRETVLGVRHHFAHQKDEAAPAPAAVSAEEEERRREKRERKRAERDEIDDVFAAVEKKRKHKHKD